MIQTVNNSIFQLNNHQLQKFQFRNKLHLILSSKLIPPAPKNLYLTAIIHESFLFWNYPVPIKSKYVLCVQYLASSNFLTTNHKITVDSEVTDLTKCNVISIKMLG